MNSNNTQVTRVACVTGAARRIGAAIVKTLHQAGFRVVIHCHHSLNEARLLAAQLNQQRADSALVVAQSLLAKNAASALIQATIAWGSRLDVLVNNASLFKRTPPEFDAKLWEQLFTVNVKLPYLLSLTAQPYLAKSQGVIINLTDSHVQGPPLKGYDIYCQTKEALWMQTKALARELAPTIRVNAIAPGAIIWPEGDNQLTVAEQQQIIRQTPLQCQGDPNWIAQAVLALVENPFITGQSLSIDGGRSLKK